MPETAPKFSTVTGFDSGLSADEDPHPAPINFNSDLAALIREPAWHPAETITGAAPAGRHRPTRDASPLTCHASLQTFGASQCACGPIQETRGAIQRTSGASEQTCDAAKPTFHAPRHGFDASRHTC